MWWFFENVFLLPPADSWLCCWWTCASDTYCWGFSVASTRGKSALKKCMRARGAVRPDREKIGRGVVVYVQRSTAQEASQKGAWYHMCMWHGSEVPSARGTKEFAPLFGAKCP